MPKANTDDQYVLLPMRGMRAKGPSATPEAQEFLRSMGEGRHSLTAGGRKFRVRVVDTIGDDGPKLVEVPPDSVAAFRALEPGLRLVPVAYYGPP
jgi:hypothetical protein